MKTAIIGSRSRCRKQDKIYVFDIVFECIKSFGFENFEIVSGGCPTGADFFAEEAAKYFGCSITVHYPQQLPKAVSYSETVERFYARNRKVARDCDQLVALVNDERKGGTEYTIKQALLLDKTCWAIARDGERIVQDPEGI